MLKYQKKGLYKALSIILAAAMFLTAPMGTQVYALEDEQPAVTYVQGELPPGASEEAETNEVLDSGIPPEVSGLSTDISSFVFIPFAESTTPPAFAVDYPKLGTAQTEGSKKIEVLVKGILPEVETSMGLGYVLLADNDSAPTAEQIKSARGKIPGVTVITWAQQSFGDTETTITLTGAQDGTDYEFYAVFWKGDTFSEVKHLDVKTPAAGSGDPGSSVLAPPTGLKWDTADGIKAKWNEVTSATSYDLTIWKEEHSTMLIQYTGFKGTEIDVRANIESSTGNYYFTVQAMAEGYTSSLKPASQIYSYIAPLYGNATISNMNPKIGDTLTGSLVYGNNTGTLHYDWKVNGSQVGADAASYTVTAADLGKTITLEISSGVETGTRTSIATAKVSAAPAVLEVTTPEELEAALGSVSDGGMIALRKSIDYDKGIVINAKSFRLDLGSYTLDVVNSTGIGIDIKNAILTVSGDGKLNATGTKGVQAHNSKISVYSATGTAGAGVEASCSSYAGGAPCEVTVTTLAQGTTAGAYAMNDDCKITAGSAKATATNGKAVYAEVGGTVEISGDVEAPNGHGVYCVNGSATIGDNVTSKKTAVFLYEKGAIVINGNVNADNGSDTAVEIDGNGIPSNGTVTIGGTVSALDALYVRFVNGVRTKNEGVPDGAYLKYMDSIDGEKAGIIRVKKVPAVCTIGAQEFTLLSDAVAAAPEGETTTITLLQSITHNESVVINGKSITFALGGFDLTIDTSAISNSTGLHVKGDGKVNCTGSGKFNVVGSNDGVRASGGSELHISGNVTARQYAVTAGSAPGTGTPKVTVDGDVTVTGQDVNAWSEVEAVSAGGYATVTIGGNVTANRTDEMQIVTAVYSNASTIVVGKNVTTQGSGVNAQNGGNVTIGGVLHYNPTGSGDQAYIKVGYPVVPKTADDFEPTSIKPEYKEYRNGDNVVWVKEAPAICTIGAQRFTSLDAAVASVPAGGTATITLLQSITHTKHIRVEKKTINLDLENYDLLLDTSADLSYIPALRVLDGGKLKLTGTGTGKFNVKSFNTAIAINGVNAEATVHNIEVTGDNDGVYMYGSGDYLESNGIVTVNGDIKTEKGNGVIVNAKNGKVIVNGKITAGKIGVEIASNPGTEVTVNGDITVIDDRPDNLYNIVGIRAYGATTVSVTGDVTVGGTNCLGIHASGSTIKVDGNVASTGKGAQSDANGKIEIVGSLSAGSPFITVGTTEMTADQGTETVGGSLLYTDGENTVQIGSIGIPEPIIYTITVQNDGNGTASARPTSAEAGTEITLTASPNSGYQFRKWQVIGGSVSITTNKFTMPSENVTVKAIFEETVATTYTVTVNNGTGGGEYAKDTVVTIKANDKSGYDFDKWVVKSGTVTLTDSRSSSTTFTMPAEEVAIEAEYAKKSSGSSSGGSSVKTDASITTKAAEFDKNSESGDNKDIKVTLSSGSYTLSDIKLNGKALAKGTDYTISGSTVIIKKEFLAELDKGEHTFIFDMSGGSDPMLKITVADTQKQEPKSNIPFTDVTASDWFADSVIWAYEKGLMSGTGTEPMQFTPYGNATRGMVVTILYRLEGEPATFGNSFDDVSDDAYYADAVRWAYAKKIVDGYGSGKFGPNDAITREQLAVILMNYAKLKGYDVSAVITLAKYSDADTVSGWALEAMTWANAAGLINGDSSKLMPKGNAQRAQAAAILQRFHEMYVK